MNIIERSINPDRIYTRDRPIFGRPGHDVTVMAKTGLGRTGPVQLSGPGANVVYTEAHITAHLTSIITSISDLGDESLVVKKPILVAVIETSEDEYLATMPIAGIAMSGSTPLDAIEGLKEGIAETFKLLQTEPKLGPEPRRQKGILEAFIGKARGQSITRG